RARGDDPLLLAAQRRAAAGSGERLSAGGLPGAACRAAGGEPPATGGVARTRRRRQAHPGGVRRHDAAPRASHRSRESRSSNDRASARRDCDAAAAAGPLAPERDVRARRAARAQLSSFATRDAARARGTRPHAIRSGRRGAFPPRPAHGLVHSFLLAVEPARARRTACAMSTYPQRIVCLTEETTETLYRLGEQDRIVGISGFTVRPARARKEKPRVCAFTSAKIDRIIALEPDLVLGFSDLQAGIAADLIRAGI